MLKKKFGFLALTGVLLATGALATTGTGTAEAARPDRAPQEQPAKPAPYPEEQALGSTWS